MIIPYKLNSIEQHVTGWITIFNGGLKLTEKEFNLLRELILLQIKYTTEGVKGDSLQELIFSSKNTKILKEKLSISKQNWGTYIANLVTKKALIQKEYIYINPMLIPQEELTFKFKI